MTADERRESARPAARPPLSPDVPATFAQDYREACLVLADPKVSAGLSRRCLQRLLREHVKVNPGELYEEIEEAANGLPPYISQALLDITRHFGNFAAHPEKYLGAGEIVDVQPGEAEWCLDILESLFDLYFVQCAALQKKKDALNAKLAEAGKPPLK